MKCKYCNQETQKRSKSSKQRIMCDECLPLYRRFLYKFRAYHNAGHPAFKDSTLRDQWIRTKMQRMKQKSTPPTKLVHIVPKKKKHPKVCKQRYWCSEFEEGYIATKNHTICKLCRKKHDIIEYNDKLHKEF